jgi:outer membrane murein-binding lipoprotein Lpp
MKYKIFALSILSAAVLTTGCDKDQTVAQQADKASAEAKDVAQNMKDYTFAQKDEFVKEMQGQMDKLNKDIDELSAKIDSSTDAVKAEAKPKLQALRDQAAKLNTTLDDAKGATESTWNTIKAATKSTYDSLKDSFNQSRQWVADKVAPH